MRNFALLRERFESRCERITETGCWIWMGKIQSKRGRDSYGWAYFSGPGRTKNPMMMAHRVSWLLYRGPIPSGMHVCHRCDVQPCVNPNHLFLGTALENVRDCINKGRAKYVCGEGNHNARLTSEAVIVILARAEPARVLAQRYGVSKTTIWRVLKGENWNHVDAPHPTKEQ